MFAQGKYPNEHGSRKRGTVKTSVCSTEVCRGFHDSFGGRYDPETYILTPACKLRVQGLGFKA